MRCRTNAHRAGIALALLACLTTAVPQRAVSQEDAQPEDAVRQPNDLGNCRVVLIDQADLPAQTAGMLTELNVTVEMIVKKGQKLGQIDDSLLQSEREVAQGEYEAAKVDSDNDVNLRFAKESSQVAQFEYEAAKLANQRSANAIPGVELKKLLHAWKRAYLSIEQADRDLEKFRVITAQKMAQLKAVENKIAQTVILAPFDGVVSEAPKHQNEWVNPGDKICRIISLDRLHVKGRVSISDYSPEQLRGRPVRVNVSLTGGRSETFDGTVKILRPEVSDDGKRFEVWAEVENRRAENEYLLRPGLVANMAIDVGGSSVPVQLGQK